MATVKHAIGDDFYEQTRAFLQHAFPEAEIPDDTIVDGVLCAMYDKGREAALKSGFPDVSLPPKPPGLLAAADAVLAKAASYPLYIAHATHHRVRSMTGATGDLGPQYQSNAPFEAKFTGHLPVVRVPLPRRFRKDENPTISTPIGKVFLSSDHLVGSLELITQKFGDQLGYTPEKVDLVTPVRISPYLLPGSRFGAIACYVGYRKATDAAPSFYILEAGMATGQAVTLYFAPSFSAPITRLGGYHPTSYSSPANYYTGLLVMNGPDPSRLTIQAQPPGAPYYIEIIAQYQPVTNPDNNPFALLAEAAARIALIGQNMGAPSGVVAQAVFADYALHHLQWIVVPRYGGPGEVSAISTAS